ncbi:hypothetical protein B0H11DRAFT_323047 [Mycena galericulata]|nr:hypothetical protein B0H11DRAFT_323047 [Mycena galericulata]
MTKKSIITSILYRAPVCALATAMGILKRFTSYRNSRTASTFIGRHDWLQKRNCREVERWNISQTITKTGFTGDPPVETSYNRIHQRRVECGNATCRKR